MGWAGRVAHIGEGRGTCKALMLKPEGKRRLGRPRSRWDEHIQKGFQKTGSDYEDRTDLAMNREKGHVVNKVMKLRVPYNARNLLTS